MEASFWKNAWVDRNIGFHLTEYNSFLLEAIKVKEIATKGACLVPLCGKTLDMIYLRDQGFSVIGFELAKQGVLEFFEENKIEYTLTKDEFYEIFQSQGLTIYCGDFFNAKKADLPSFDLIYDRASNIALPSEMRTKYYAKIKELSSPKSEMILMTMMGEKTSDGSEDLIGPPFSISKEETIEAYQTECEFFEILEERKMKINSKRLKDAGIISRKFLGYYLKFK
ncbi:hypothetical protein A9Q84_15615 [Halobacteriovorax marinus]|uniref:thiopurine S-methyltransferase n=1 Tax=Halobacteriovorax marinus TaxID=97084 RepID=A0A1Y5F3W5_9BACT|nr:hypothetical protein A9Q84_15615 [Halobacteriovorax marinus]